MSFTSVHRSAYAHGGAPNNGFFIDEGSKGFLFESNVGPCNFGKIGSIQSMPARVAYLGGQCV